MSTLNSDFVRKIPCRLGDLNPGPVHPNKVALHLVSYSPGQSYPPGCRGYWDRKYAYLTQFKIELFKFELLSQPDKKTGWQQKRLAMTKIVGDVRFSKNLQPTIAFEKKT